MSHPSLDSLPDTKWSRLLRWQAGETPGPWEISVSLTNRCNLKCVMCWERWAEKEFGNSIYDKRREVDEERLIRLVDESAAMGVRQWTVMGSGEAMVRADTAMAMCRRIKELGMFGIMHTNGTLFKEKHYEELIEMRWDKLQVSLDGPDTAINDTIRSRGAYERTMECLRLLKNVRERMHSDLPLLTLHPVMTNLNYDKLNQILELAHSLGAAGIGLSHLTGDFEGVHALSLNPEQRAQLPEYLQQVQHRAEELGMTINTDFLLRAEAQGNLPRPARQADPILNSRCYEAWLSLYVLVDGKAGPCCVFYDEQAQSIRDKTLEEIWTGPYMQNARKVLGAGKELGYCKDCPTYIPLVMEQVAEDYRLQYKPWQRMGAVKRAQYLLGRTVSSVRERGVKTTIRRAREWVSLHGR